MSPDAPPLLTSLLEQVSRSFYKTLWILPRSVRNPISLAYLLARTTDTIADTEILPLEQRLDALRQFGERIAGANPEPLDFTALARAQGSPAERMLLERSGETLDALDQTSEADRKRIRQVLQTIVSGQELDLQRFDGASATQIRALATDAELDDYTYRVAGCVGEFWTEMCRTHVDHAFEMDPSLLAEPDLTKLAIRFGKGLQLVNILRDLPRDLRTGRCYLPKGKLRSAGLVPADLLDPGNETRIRPLYNSYLDLAKDHLTAGWRYTQVARSPRIRLACAWPILIGMRTLALLRRDPILDPGKRIKIGRSEVKRIVLRSLLTLPVPPLWRRCFASASRDA